VGDLARATALENLPVLADGKTKGDIESGVVGLQGISDFVEYLSSLDEKMKESVDFRTSPYPNSSVRCLLSDLKQLPLNCLVKRGGYGPAEEMPEKSCWTSFFDLSMIFS
jgi:hypothetical protein